MLHNLISINITTNIREASCGVSEQDSTYTDRLTIVPGWFAVHCEGCHMASSDRFIAHMMAHPGCSGRCGWEPVPYGPELPDGFKRKGRKPRALRA